MDAGFNTIQYKAAPAIWGSLKDTTPLQLAYQGAPFLEASQAQGETYVMDNLGRLSQVNYTNGTSIVFNYDHNGNRTSVVTTAGPHGL